MVISPAPGPPGSPGASAEQALGATRAEALARATSTASSPKPGDARGAAPASCRWGLPDGAGTASGAVTHLMHF